MKERREPSLLSRSFPGPFSLSSPVPIPSLLLSLFLSSSSLSSSLPLSHFVNAIGIPIIPSPVVRIPTPLYSCLLLSHSSFPFLSLSLSRLSGAESESETDYCFRVQLNLSQLSWGATTALEIDCREKCSLWLLLHPQPCDTPPH